MAVLKDLIVHGRSRFVNGAQFNTINAESIGAEQGIFNKLVATTLDAKTATVDDLTAKNAIVTGLLDVQGQMQTNSWTNANIATIDGSFYICPTISSEATVTDSGTTQISNNKFVYNNSGGTIVLTGTWATSGSLYLDNSATDWTLFSKVMITGEVLIGNEWTPIGTIRGTLNGINISAGTITIGNLSTNVTVKEGMINSVPAILSLVTSGTTYNARKLKVSLYEYNSSGTSSGATNLIGIMMTTAGTHGFTYLDIYNGKNSKTSYTSTLDNTTQATEPMVRIGNLNGLPNIVNNGGNDTKPSGWGIYTTNGFFKGKIVANAGRIGGYTIGTDNLTKGTTRDASGSFWITPAQSSNSSMSQLTTAQWAITTGQNFGVTTGGILYAKGANVSDVTLKTLTVNDNNNVKRVTVDGQGLIIYNNFNLPSGEGDTTILTNIPLAKFTDTIEIYRPGTDNIAVKIDGQGNAYLNNITFIADSKTIARIGSSGLIIYDGDGTSDTNIVATIGESISLGQAKKSTQILIDANKMSFLDVKQSQILELNTNGGQVKSTHEANFNIILENNNENTRLGSDKIYLNDGASPTTVTINGPIVVRFDMPFHSIVKSTNCYTEIGGSNNDDKHILNFYPSSSKGNWTLNDSVKKISFSAELTKTFSYIWDNFTVRAIINITLSRGDDISSKKPYLFWNLNFSPDNAAKNVICYGTSTHFSASGSLIYTSTTVGPYFAIGTRDTRDISTKGLPGGFSTTIGLDLISYGATAQTVIGRLNTENSNSAFIIGNGDIDTGTRSNALAVSWTGDLAITGNFIGKIVTSSTTLPQFSGAPSYLVGIEAFADGGQMKWASASAVSVGYATSAGSAGSASSATTCTYPAGFVSRNDNATWGNTIGTTITCWNEVNGGSIDFRRDNPSSGKMSVKVDGRFYYNEGNTPVWGLTATNGYWGMTDPDGKDGSDAKANCWIRTTKQGLIPYESGGAGNGHQSLGTAAWYFSAVYADNIYAVNGTYSGNIMAQGMAGQIIMFGGATSKIPLGWLPCDGSSVLIADYPLLAAALYDGSTYVWGQVDSTHFNLPDLRGRAPIGVNGDAAATGLTARTVGTKNIGEETHTLSAAESGLPAHTHSFTQPDVKYDVVYRQTASSGGGVRNCTAGGKSSFSLSGGAVGAVTGGAKSASSAHNNMQPSAVVNFIICTGQIN